MTSPAIKPSAAIPPPSGAAASLSPKKMNGKFSLFSHIKYEHMVAGVSGKIIALSRRQSIRRFISDFLDVGGVTSTLILHPLDLIKIRFAGE